jgi:hypothetical protein
MSSQWTLALPKNIDTSSLRRENKQAPRFSLPDRPTTRAASSRLSLSYLIFSCCQLHFCEIPKHITALHYRYDIKMYCTFVPFVNQHFPRLLASGTHCINFPTFWRNVMPPSSRQIICPNEGRGTFLLKLGEVPSDSMAPHARSQ